KAKGLVATFSSALFDHGVRMQHNSQLVQLAKTPALRIHPDTAKQYKLGTHLRIQALLAPITLDVTVAPNTVVIPLGFDSLPAYECGPNLLNGLSVDYGNLA